jgi:hypothetical protein
MNKLAEKVANPSKSKRISCKKVNSLINLKKIQKLALRKQLVNLNNFFKKK